MADVLPVPLAYEPAGARVQDVAPVVLLNVPGAQGVAAVLPVAPTYEPGGARVQAVAPAVLLNVPAAHRVAAVLPGLLT